MIFFTDWIYRPIIKWKFKDFIAVFILIWALKTIKKEYFKNNNLFLKDLHKKSKNNKNNIKNWRDFYGKDKKSNKYGKYFLGSKKNFNA